jgi:hypothetical protein
MDPMQESPYLPHKSLVQSVQILEHMHATCEKYNCPRYVGLRASYAVDDWFDF